jgi:UDP-N-acetylmuramoyl-tripeptide--D-alanyl-D-alanine ligase
MTGMTLQQVFAWIQSREPRARLVGDGATPLARVHTDTRTLQPGDLFVALRGERFDAHDFLAQARASGAVAALAERGLQAAGLPGIEVPDSLQALGHLAAAWRAQFNLPLIAVTGSNGKTTVTQMIAAILQAHAQDAAFATRGNLNNAIGVPQTLLRLNASHRVGVVELGMNHPGEIALLARIAQPTVALVNNAQREHLEFMHTVQAVAEENGSVLAALPEDGVAVFPAGDAYTALWQHLAAGRRCITFGGAQADVRCTQAQWQGGAWRVILATPQGPLDCALHIAGRHNVTNAQAAAACALAAGVPLDAIARGLSAFAPVKGRSRALGVRAASAPSPWWTTATTPTRTPCTPPSRCWPNCPRRACWCWAIWARWATRGRSSTPRPGPMRVHAASSGCTRWARCRGTPRRPLARPRILTTWHRSWQRCGRRCPRWAACW